MIKWKIDSYPFIYLMLTALGFPYIRSPGNDSIGNNNGSLNCMKSEILFLKRSSKFTLLHFFLNQTHVNIFPIGIADLAWKFEETLPPSRNLYLICPLHSPHTRNFGTSSIPKVSLQGVLVNIYARKFNDLIQNQVGYGTSLYT